MPGGTAVLPSSALMLSVPAGLAGCGTIVLATPPRSDGSVSAEVPPPLPVCLSASAEVPPANLCLSVCQRRSVATTPFYLSDSAEVPPPLLYIHLSALRGCKNCCTLVCQRRGVASTPAYLFVYLADHQNGRWCSKALQLEICLSVCGVFCFFIPFFCKEIASNHVFMGLSVCQSSGPSCGRFSYLSSDNYLQQSSGWCVCGKWNCSEH